nr:hypothetical protein CFP56_00449 [Quercus suber]
MITTLPRQSNPIMPPTIITDLPPELIDHVATFLPTAAALANFSGTNKYIHKCVEADGWSAFNHTKFPSLCPQTTSSHKDTARTLTTLSRAWDRRALVTRALEPHGPITVFPGVRKVEKWQRPKGQTIGFTPHVDVFEHVGPGRRQRREVLAFSAGAELCIRDKRGEDAQWLTYKPVSAFEGRDDITTLHLLRNDQQDVSHGLQVVLGTANGDLKVLRLPDEGSKDLSVSEFVTQRQPVRSSSLLERSDGDTLLAAGMGDSRVSIFPISPSSSSRTAPLSSIDIRPHSSSSRSQHIWSTTFLSPQHIAIGSGPTDHPLNIYAVTPSGLSDRPVREFSLPNSVDDLVEGSVPLAASLAKKITTSVYPIVPLPPSSTACGHGNIFLSGAYDGVIRLHDLRSSSEVEQAYVDPSDDSAIYSLLLRGQESIVAGTARHSLLKVFDMRLGAKSYSYLQAAPTSVDTRPAVGMAKGDWNLFLRPSIHRQTRHGRGSSRSRLLSETSVYSIASPSPSSPYIYAGVENSVLEFAITSVLDKHPDPTFFTDAFTAPKNAADTQRNKQVVDLAMYDQTTSSPKLYTQKSLWETARTSGRGSAVAHTLAFPPAEPGLDERWKLSGH